MGVDVNESVHAPIVALDAERRFVARPARILYRVSATASMSLEPLALIGVRPQAQMRRWRS